MSAGARMAGKLPVIDLDGDHDPVARMLDDAEPAVRPTTIGEPELVRGLAQHGRTSGDLAGHLIFCFFVVPDERRPSGAAAAGDVAAFVLSVFDTGASATETGSDGRVGEGFDRTAVHQPHP